MLLSYLDSQRMRMVEECLLCFIVCWLRQEATVVVSQKNHGS